MIIRDLLRNTDLIYLGNTERAFECQSQIPHQLGTVIGSLAPHLSVLGQTDVTLYVLVPVMLPLSFTAQQLGINPEMLLGLKVGN